MPTVGNQDTAVSLAGKSTVISTVKPIVAPVNRPLPISGLRAFPILYARIEQAKIRASQAKHANTESSTRAYTLSRPSRILMGRRNHNEPFIGGANPFATGGDVLDTNAQPGGLPQFGRRFLGGGTPAMKSPFRSSIAKPLSESVKVASVSPIALAASAGGGSMAGAGDYSSGSLSDLNLTEAQPTENKNGGMLILAALASALFFL